MKSRLSFLEAVSLIVGAGVGGGVLAVPYLADRAGMAAFLAVIPAAAAANIVLNLLLVDVLVRDGRLEAAVGLALAEESHGRGEAEAGAPRVAADQVSTARPPVRRVAQGRGGPQAQLRE